MPEKARRNRYRCTYRFERQLREQGFRRIAGIDEVGRGALCGPVVAAAVMFDARPRVRGIRDSKILTAQRREALSPQIARCCLGHGVGIVSAEEIDRINIYQATLKAMGLALQQLDPAPDFVLIDGTPVKGFPIPSLSVVKGDARSLTIAAASIIAKVIRDRLMLSYAAMYPMYDWEKNKGYSCKKHFEAIKNFGTTSFHRRSFRPAAEEKQFTLSGIGHQAHLS